MVLNYRNNFGAIDQDKISYYDCSVIKTISLKNIIKIKYQKQRIVYLNYILFLFSILLIASSINNNLSDDLHLILLTISLILIVASFYFKIYEYRFVIIKKSYIIEVKVPKKQSAEAQELASRINEIIEEIQFNKTHKNQGLAVLKPNKIILKPNLIEIKKGQHKTDDSKLI